MDVTVAVANGVAGRGSGGEFEELWGAFGGDSVSVGEMWGKGEAARKVLLACSRGSGEVEGKVEVGGEVFNDKFKVLIEKVRMWDLVVCGDKN